MVARSLALTLLATSAQAVSPIEKVLQLLSGLETKVKSNGEKEAKAFKEFFGWCKNAAADNRFQLKTSTAQKASLEATIGKSVADGEEAQSVIEEKAQTIAAAEADLKEASAIRTKEHDDFAEVETELVDAVDTLNRAIAILEREMQKKPAMLQQVSTKNMHVLIQTLDTMLNAVSVSIPDRKKLMTLMQAQGQQQTDDDDEGEIGAPQAAAFESKSGSIIDILEDMKEKAETELAEARKAEGTARHNFNMMKQSLEDQMKADTKEKTDAESTKSISQENKAKAEGDLELTAKDLNNAKDNLQTVSTDCMTAAADQEASIKSRTEELNVLAQAKKIIAEGTKGAQGETYSFLQVRNIAFSHNRKGGSFDGVRSMLRTKVDLVNVEIVTMIKHLAKEQHSSTLTQLASKIDAVVRYGSGAGEDPFVKVKQLISDMIAKLEDEAHSQANQKEYCDTEMQKTKEKKTELSTTIDKMTTKLDKAAADSTKLKEEVAELQKEIGTISRQTVEMDKARSDENAVFVEAKADLEQGIKALQNALTVLREYYGSASGDPALLDLDQGISAADMQPAPPKTHSSAGGAGSSIISMLEVAESDFAKSLAVKTSAEETSASEYDKVTQENKISKAMKEQDVKYKGSEAKSHDKRIAEDNSELETLHTEMGAVMEYSEKLDAMCVAKPDSYEERKGRREAEINGLREALTYLDGGSMLQRKKRNFGLLQREKRHFRGSK